MTGVQKDFPFAIANLDDYNHLQQDGGGTPRLHQASNQKKL